ncbi:PREDICTED: universal stress protein A-like protein [Prunus mume]|uniref:Universal stress protein A-like protein n=1 Tax=Prunus mume TaxID=102107 RepID=A0ABM0NUV4_PRUMU|nr:PREDICTED: universal stress protein A-like protein [Prunus mume]
MNPPPSVDIQPSSSRFPLTSAAPTASGGDQRKVAIAVDLSEESAFAVQWAVQNYLRPGDSVVLLHVRPTSVLYGADWGSVNPNLPNDAVSSSESRRKLEDDFDAFTTTNDVKGRLGLEVERLRLGVVIMGSRGFGAAKRAAKVGRLGSVTDYCVHHCVCPVVVVRFPDDSDGSEPNGPNPVELHPVPEEDQEELSDADSGEEDPQEIA